MSEIRANTVSNAAGTGPVTLTGQAANKAWVMMKNGRSTLAVGDSLNVSSIVDASTAQYTANWSSNFNTIDYAMTAGCLGQGYSYSFGSGVYASTVGTVYSNWLHHSGVNYDIDEASIMATGVLA